MLARVLLTKVAQCEHRHLRASLVRLNFAVAERDLNASREQLQIVKKNLSSSSPAAVPPKPDDCARTSSSQSRGRVQVMTREEHEMVGFAAPSTRSRLLRLSLMTAAVLGVAAYALLINADNLARAVDQGPATRAATTGPAQTDPIVVRGLELYRANCAACHGDKGLGDGQAAYLLYPKARNFSEGLFRLTTAPQGLPTDEELLRTLRRGMPGSAMPPWGHLPEQDLRALVAAVRALAIEGKADVIMRASKSMKREKALQLAHGMLDPRPATPLPPRPAEAKLDLARGKTIYAANCAACHDADGRGKNKRDLTDTSGYPVFSRDFTLGIFKGGSAADDIARRLTVGMPGSPMPAAAELSPDDLWSLVAYIQTFIQPGAQARVEQSQQKIAAKKVSSAALADRESDAWKSAAAHTLALMPLWWRDDRVEVVTVRALHDGSQIAIQLSWDDPTADDLPVKPQSFTDGVAIEFASAKNPPLFAMGARGAPVDIWYWKASRQRDAAATQPALAAAYPNRDTTDSGAVKEPVYDTATAAGNLVAQVEQPKSVESLKAEGFGTLTARGPGAQLADGSAQRTATGWQVTFVHKLGAEEQDSAAVFTPGKTVSISFAVWDGHSGDRNGQKSITIWHQLELEP